VRQVCEKETKTKAFSKEGLGAAPKTDPKEQKRAEAREYINHCTDEVNMQIDTFEAEMEGLPVKKGKARPPRLVHLEDSVSRHKEHILRLEQVSDAGRIFAFALSHRCPNVAGS
jgi:CCR4-NOT transcription complex subunit 3